jgi:signal transduction histidine kinase
MGRKLNTPSDPGMRQHQRAGGQGFGLAIVAEIITPVGGAMSFAKDGPGLTVRLTLPRVPDRL